MPGYPSRVVLKCLPLLIALLLAPAAWADASVAATAAEVAEAHCVDGVSGDVQIAANALIQVGGTWAEVDEAWLASREPSLLYWRARLAQCLDKEDRALEDFAAFLESYGEDPAYAQQSEDARRRMRFLYVRVGEPEGDEPDVATVAGVALGGGLVGGAGVLAALAGWQDAQARDALARYHGGDLVTSEFPGVQLEIQQAGTTANALLGVAVGLASGGAAVLIATGALTAREDAKERSRPRVSVLPTPLGLQVRW